jgi:hypothetical protein
MLQTGVVFCVLALIPGLAGVRSYNDPKEMVLDLIGPSAAGLCLMSVSTLEFDWTDLLLSLFLLVSIASASFAVSDRWEALRAVGLNISGAAIFWSSRHLAQQGQRRRLLDAVAVAVVVVSVSVLVDAFGYGLDFPCGSAGGTLGNRNWAAHLIALGLPLLTLKSITAQTTTQRAATLCAMVVLSATLVLTRSRTAWIAAVLGTVLPLVVATVSSRRARALASTTRCVAALSAVLAGVLGAILMPTQLRWSSSNPYLESAKGITAYDSGSGQARLEQYRRSLTMAGDHPALGVGPGNWRIVYPAYLPKRIPPRLWYPRLGNSDWIGLAAERGLPAMILYFAALASVAIGCWRSFVSLRKMPGPSESALEPLCLIAILVALAVVGSLDAVLQLPAATFVFFLMLGTLTPRGDVIASVRLSRNGRIVGILTTLLIAAALGLYMIDRMYCAFLVARARGDDLQIASLIVVDSDWLYNEKLWLRFRRALRTREVVTSDHD